jgi:hypothetical protein
MKKKIYFFLIIFLSASSWLFAQQKTENPENQVHQYWFVMLTKGATRSQDSIQAAKIQEGHMANIRRLYGEGKLKVAGPFGDEGKWIGLFIFDFLFQMMRTRAVLSNRKRISAKANACHLS